MQNIFPLNKMTEWGIRGVAEYELQSAWQMHTSSSKLLGIDSSKKNILHAASGSCNTFISY